MEPDTPPPVGFFLTLCCFLTGVDPELLRRCPPRDRSSVVTITLLMLAIWLWQTLAFALTAHMLLDEMRRIRPELVAVSALLAGVVMLIDSFTIIRSSWFLSGLAQLQRGGLAIPGAVGARIKNGLQLLFRLPLAGVLAELAAIGFMLFCFALEIDHRLAVNAIAENAAIASQVAVGYDAGSARLVTGLERLRMAAAAARTDTGSYRRDTLQTPAEDSELKPAREQVQRAEKAKVEAERRLSRVARHDEVGRQLALQRLGARKAELQAAQARVDRLRGDAEAAAKQRREAVQGRLDETLTAEKDYRTRIDALEKQHAARLAAREDSIRAAVLRDPGYRPPDRGLLARVKVLAQLMDDAWVFTVATLLHVGFFGIELGAVLCKVLTSVPSAYAVTLAGEEYAHEVETANTVFRRIGGQQQPEQESDDPAPPEPDAPTPGNAGAALPESTANDDVAPVETEDTTVRLEEGARLAKVQAAARAKVRDKPAPNGSSKASAPSEATTLIGNILDGPVRRGRGRPLGARNRPKTGNDDAATANGVEAGQQHQLPSTTLLDVEIRVICKHPHSLGHSFYYKTRTFFLINIFCSIRETIQCSKMRYIFTDSVRGHCGIVDMMLKVATPLEARDRSYLPKFFVLGVCSASQI